MLSILLSVLVLAYILSEILRDESLFSSLSLSLLIILGLLGFVPYYLVTYSGYEFRETPLIILLGIILIALIFSLTNKKENKTLGNLLREITIDRWSILLVGIVALLVIRAHFLNVRGWDAYALYDMRAVFFLDNINLQETSKFSAFDIQHVNYYLSYPPMTSVLHSVVYSLKKTSPMVLYALFYGIFIVLYRNLLKSLRINRYLKILLFLLVALNPLILGQLNIAYTNLPMLAFLFSSYYCLIHYLEKKRLPYLLLSSFFLGFAMWTRSAEPIYLVFFIATAYSIYKHELSLRKKLIYFVSYIFFPLVIFLLWREERARALISIDNSVGYLGLLLTGLANLSIATLKDVSNFIVEALRSFHGYFIVFFGAYLLSLFPKKKNNLKEAVTLLMLVTLSAMMFIGTFIFAAGKSWWNKIPGSFLRTNILFVPLLSSSIAFYSEKIYAKAKKKKRKKKKIIIIQGTQAPYRFPIFRELEKKRNLDLHVWFMSRGKLKNRTWSSKPLKRYSFKYKYIFGWVLNFGFKDNFPFWVNPLVFVSILKEKPDLVVMLGWDSLTSFLIHFASKISGTKFVLWSGSTVNETSWRRTVTKPLVAIHTRSADAHIAYGTMAKNYLVSLGVDPERIFISYNATDVGRYKKLCREHKKEYFETKKELSIPLRAKVVMYYGQLIERKGGDLLLDAFSLKHKNKKDAILLFAGTGPFFDDLKEKTVDMKIQNVRFLENPGDEEICKYYAIADIFVLPSREEVWGLVVNEAMACGLPVIVSSAAGSSADLVIEGKNGFVFKSENSRDLANKLTAIMEDKKLRENMGEKSKEISNKFVPSKTVKGFYKMFKYLGLWE